MQEALDCCPVWQPCLQQPRAGLPQARRRGDTHPRRSLLPRAAAPVAAAEGAAAAGAQAW